MEKTAHAMCQDCRREMKPSNGCEHSAFRMVTGVVVDKLKYEGKICHDCNTGEGQFHHLGCDMERCPVCGGQLISCDHFRFIEESIKKY